MEDAEESVPQVPASKTQKAVENTDVRFAGLSNWNIAGRVCPDMGDPSDKEHVPLSKFLLRLFGIVALIASAAWIPEKETFTVVAGAIVLLAGGKLLKS